jgi:uncharacterized membrane protein
MRPPVTPTKLFIFILILVVLLLIIQIGIFTVVLDKLGLSPHSAMSLLIVTLIGSGINLPLSEIDIPPDVEPQPNPFAQWLPVRQLHKPGKTIIAINVGGALVPVLFSLYLISITSLSLSQLLIAIGVVSFICYNVSRPVQGLGIGMPIFIAPFTAAITAILISPQNSAPLAYICGTMGVLIGADILRIKDVPKLGAPIASIGGAGTFDGIFLTGIVAVLLA